MMAELEIDQSHLPRVQKVCQCFAVLEDGVLAHSLQEQEIEQHYSSNVQKSQRVQTDLRVARRLQDEEEREAPLSQTARRLEEQDFEYALMIQDEIQRCAEETRRREREDEEVAKRIQEEEEMGAKYRKLESGCHGNSTTFPFCEEHHSNRHLPPPSVLASTRFIPCPRPLWPPATRGQRPVCGASAEPITDPLSPVCGTSQASRLGARPAAVLGPIQNGPGNSRSSGCGSGRGSGCGSGRGSGVLWWLTTAAHRPGKWLNSAPCGQLGASGYTQGEGSCCFCRRLREDRAGGGGKERIVGLGGQGPGTDLRSAGEGSRGARGGNVCPQGGVCRWTYRANGAAAERRVHFLDEGRRCHSYHGDRKRGSLGCVDSPDSGRCRAVRRGYHGDLTQRAGGGGVDGVTVGSVEREDPVWHSYRGNTSSGQRGTRGVFSGDGGQGRGPDRSRERRGEALGNREGGVSHRGSGNQDYGTPVSETDSACHHGDGAEREALGGGSHRNCQKGGGGGEGGRGRRCGASVSGVQEGVASGRGYRGNQRAKWRARRRWRGSVEESSSEEEVQRREERRKRGGVRHNEQAEGAELWQRGAGLWQRGAGLELGSLQQVLLDQELAWSLQEEEENIHRKLRRGSRSPPRPPSADPEDDFRAAQVAQDEEIARFMQRQEMKTKWRSCDLEGQGSQGERDDSGDVRQSRECPERKLQVQREELPSASEERIDPPKPASTVHQRQPIRNIAEELDPTFKARGKGMSQARPTSSDLCLTPPTPHRGFHDYTDEPFFIPPTKRRSDRSGRGKAKEKKEGCKQQ